MRRQPELSPQEKILDWADPDPRLFSGAAFSEEHMLYITSEVSRLRQEWLRSEIISRITGEVVEMQDEITAEQYFYTLQNVPHISREFNRSKGPVTTQRNLDREYSWHYSDTDAREMWGVLMHWYCLRAGFRPWATKYDNFYYEPDSDTPYAKRELAVRFKKGHRDSVLVAQKDFAAEFMMDGILYIHHAAVALDGLTRALERWNEDYDFSKWCPTPVAYWRPVVELAWEDQSSVASYGELVEEIEEDVYFAPYFHPELRASGDFINLDDMHSACARLGIDDRLRSRMWGFVLGNVLSKPAHKFVMERMYQGGVTTRDSGVVFMDKDALELVDEKIEGISTKQAVAARQVIDELSAGDEYDIDYEYLAFNR